MFVTTEIARTQAITTSYVPTLWPGVISYDFYYGAANEDIATFWSGTFGVTEPLTDRTSIVGVVYEYTVNYAQKELLTECLAALQSYFWDIADQKLYIHLGRNQQLDYIDPNMDYGVALGLTNDTYRYFGGRPFAPLLLSFPAIETDVDKFDYDKLSFIVDSLTYDNKSGFFNQFRNTPLYGNKVIIKTGKEGDLYTDLIERAVYFVDDYQFSADEFTLEIQDIRKTNSVQIPNTFLSTTDYPYLSDSSIGKVIPEGFGPLHDIPGLLVNEAELNGILKPKFIFLKDIVGSIDSDMSVWIKNADDVWQPLTPTTDFTVNWTTGVVTIPAAETVTGSDYGAFPVKADLTGQVNTYASDIIKTLNLDYLGIIYDTSNYDTTTWESEETFLKPIAFYMDTTKDIYEWYKDLQSLSSVGFRYTSNVSNKRVILVDNPNKAVRYAVPSIRIKDIATIEAKSNKELVRNKIYIGYNESILNKTAPQYEDATYYDISFAEYKILRVYNKISGLTSLIDATNRAKIQAEDYYKIRKEFECVLIGEEYLDIEVYDIITVDLTLQTKQFVYNQIVQESLSSDIVYQGGLEEDSSIIAQLAQLEVELVGDEYFGVIRGQVISRKPDYDYSTNTVVIRQRPYSNVWETIYGS